MTSTTRDTELSTSPSIPRVTALVTRVKTQWAQLTTQSQAAVKTRWERAGERLRGFLGLPGKDELASLAARLDEIEQRLGKTTAAVAEKRVRKPKPRAKA